LKIKEHVGFHQVGGAGKAGGAKKGSWKETPPSLPIGIKPKKRGKSVGQSGT